MKRVLALIAVLLVLALWPISSRQASLNVASKKFTESVILGEIVTQLSNFHGVSAIHFQELGGTRVTFNALLEGEIDIYPEYTGTITQEILADRQFDSWDQVVTALDQQGIGVIDSLGFNNTYAVGVLKQRAAQLNLSTISDLNKHPQLRFGFTNEFMDRADGWPALAKHYGLTHADVRGLDHDIAYRQLAAGAIDVTDVYTTDAKIRSMDLTLLADDREFFPRYDAVLLFRKDLATRFPDLMPRLALLRNRISVQQMVVLNHQVEIERVPESTVAAEWLHKQFGISVTSSRKTTLQLIGVSTMEHLDLVRKSLIPAIFVGIPMGVVAAKRPVLGSLTLGSVGVIQTIPALALLVILMPVVNKIGGQSLGVGSLTAVLALFLYSLLPIVRNTSSGLANIETQYLESARAMGLSPAFRLWHIELPLASRSILAGIKTAAVINVGFATLGALIGAGGYGQPILTGIRLADTGLILRGAIPAAVLALVVQGIFDILERFVIPRGLNP